MGAHPGDHRHTGEVTRARNRRALAGALIVTAAFAAVEAAGGLLTGSLALLADAGHMLTDLMALSLSLFAVWMAGRPSPPRKTFGYYRAEILAALVNGAALVLLSLGISWQAVHRFSHPPVVDSGPMIVVAVVGLLANLTAGAILLRAGGGGESLNVRGALLHVAGDALGSAGAIGAGAVILTTGWAQADAVASLIIAALILLGAWRLLLEAADVLLEGAPARLNMAEMERAMLSVPGVAAVHDVHVWTVTSGFVAMSGHAELDGSRDAHSVLDTLTETLARRFNILHVTIQPETDAHAADCCAMICEPDRGRPAAPGVAAR